MWPSVAREIDSFLGRFEGARLRHMYLDKAGRVATWTGLDINSPAAAEVLTWTHAADGSPASEADVDAEWRRVDALQSYAGVGGDQPVFRDSAVLQVDPDSATAYQLRLFAAYEAALRSSAHVGPAWDTIPADAQLARLRTDYADGAASAWPKLDAAIARGDFRTAEDESQPKDLRTQTQGYRDSYTAVKLLYRNAAAVVARGLDPSVLYYPEDLGAPGGGGTGGGGELAITAAVVVVAGVATWAYVQEWQPAWWRSLLRSRAVRALSGAPARRARA